MKRTILVPVLLLIFGCADEGGVSSTAEADTATSGGDTAWNQQDGGDSLAEAEDTPPTDKDAPGSDSGSEGPEQTDSESDEDSGGDSLVERPQQDATEADSLEAPDGAEASDAGDADFGLDGETETDTEPRQDSTTDPDAADPDATELDAAGPDIGEADSGGPGPDPGPLYDPAWATNAADAACVFSSGGTQIKDGVLIAWEKVLYRSVEWIDGSPNPIWIRGYFAKPAMLSSLRPGVVLAHGLGGEAKLEGATGLAALTGAAVIAYTGPGGGSVPDNTSEGLPSGYGSGYRMFDTLVTPKGSWFWAHSAAAMRALTCLQGRVDVDGTRLGITGYSAGGVASLTVAAWDPRVKAAVPLSGTGRWDLATESPKAWQHALLDQAGLTIASAEWAHIVNTVEPGAWGSQTAAQVFIVNGTSDEFFPITSHTATLLGLPAGKGRHSLAGNFDHGCYLLTGGEPAATIEDRASLRAAGAQRALFAHAFGTDSDFAVLPALPTLSLESVGATVIASATVDTSASALQVEEVRVWFSIDKAFFWINAKLDPIAGPMYGAVLPGPAPADLVAFVDVTYKSKKVLEPKRFSVSSVPSFPAGFVPHIRAIDTCQ